MKKILMLFYCIACIASFVAAQTFSEKLTTIYGAFAPSQIVSSKNGGIYILGDANIIQAAHDEAYVAELNSEGKLLWDKSFNTSDGMSMKSIVELKNGTLYLETNAGYFIKVNSNHSINFIKRLKLPNITLFTSTLLKDEKGNFIISGSYGSQRDPSVNNAYLMKTDSNLTVIWAKKIMDKANAQTVIRTSNGGFAIAGVRYSDTSGAKRYLYLMETDSAGTIQWTTQVDIDDFNFGLKSSVIETSDKGFMVTSGDIVKFTRDGKVSWVKKLNSPGLSYEFTTDVLSAGHPEIPLLTDKQTLVTTFANSNYTKAYILYTLIDNEGNIFKKKFAFVDSMQTGLGLTTVATDNDGNIWSASGHSYPGVAFMINRSAANYNSCHTINATLDSVQTNVIVTYLNLTTTDLAITTNNVSSLQQDSGKTTIITTCGNMPVADLKDINSINKKSAILISPNPVNNVLHLTGLGRSIKYVVTITDDKGIPFINTQVNYASSFDLNVKTLTQHVYYLRITSNNNTIIKTFIKQ